MGLVGEASDRCGQGGGPTCTTDFRTKLFPGSQRLIELADRVETLQVEAMCWCGARATPCRRHHRKRMTSAAARAAALSPDVLPVTSDWGR